MPSTRAEKLLALSPQLIADVKMYATAESGRKQVADLGWACACTVSTNCWKLDSLAKQLVPQSDAPVEVSRRRPGCGHWKEAHHSGAVDGSVRSEATDKIQENTPVLPVSVTLNIRQLRSDDPVLIKPEYGHDAQRKTRRSKRNLFACGEGSFSGCQRSRSRNLLSSGNRSVFYSELVLLAGVRCWVSWMGSAGRANANFDHCSAW